MRVAVVGGGVSGLASAYVLAKNGIQVVLFEKEQVLGGRAKTLRIDDIALDLGFMVFTRNVYPDVMELFESVGVDMELTDGSFSVSLDEGKGFEWGTRKGLSTLFSQKMNLLNPCFWKMIREIIKLKYDASTYLEELDKNPDTGKNETLRQFIESHNYSELFQKAFLIPICASIWSCSWTDVMSFSAYSVLSFLCSHDLQILGNSRKLTPTWRSQSYVEKIWKELENRGCEVRMNSQVYSVLTDDDDGCVITCKDGLEEKFDGCIVALRAPDALNILGKQPTSDELRILGAYKYAYSDLYIHHDNNLMPKKSTTWGSRNFLTTTDDRAYTTYWLNNLQNISEHGLPFLLSINPPGAGTPKNTLYKCSTSHLIPSVAASMASSEMSIIQGKRRLWFCGAYQGYGFPEDGIKAALVAASGLLRRGCTIAYNSRRCMMAPSFSETGARFLVVRFLERFIVVGCLTLLEEGGGVFTFEGTTKKSSLKVTVRIHNPRFYWKVATEADLGFADAFINGDISFVDKNEGLLNFFLIIAASSEVNTYTSKLSKKRGWWTPLLYTSIISSAKYFFKQILKKNKLSQTRQNISEHYDLSNEFFSLFMDETMAYSCAIFKTPGEDLKNAQLRKTNILIEKARIKKEHHILEIGFGWGHFALEVVKRTGCKYTGITLSEKQLEYVHSKVKETGLQDQIELLLCDYRQLPNNHKYDRIIASEVLEHVGHEFMEHFFQCCESALAQSGLLVIQVSVMAEDKYDETRLSTGFIREYIFPGGCAPSLSRLISAMAAASRLSAVHIEEIGNHYFDTLKHWRKNLLQNHDQVVALGFDEKFIRTWEYYFDYCAAGFKYCLTGNYQIVCSRPGDVAAFGNDPYNPVPSSY